MQKFLIIGSKGFIGQNLITHLLKEGITEIWGADVIVDYNANKYFLIDASNADFNTLFKDQSFDVCINCSGAASVPHSLQKPLRDYHLNTVNVFKLLEAIRVHQPHCKFINLSSAAVYGNPVQLPILERTEIVPVSPYGNHKWMSEQICDEYYRYFDIPTCSLRIFSAFGEGLKKQLFWDLHQKALTGTPIKLYGTGQESRDFIYIKDLVKVIYLVAQKAPFKGDTINVANGEEIFIKDVVETYYNFFNTSIAYEFSGEGRKGDPNNWVADIGLLKSMGYQPSFTMKEGLHNFYKWVVANGKK